MLTLCRNSGKVCVWEDRGLYRSEDVLQVRREDKPQLHRHDYLRSRMWYDL